MIKRFLTKCLTCGHNNTLRVTLGTDVNQSHSFPCYGCGQRSSIRLEIDFVNRDHLLDLGDKGSISSPSIKGSSLDNLEWSEEEGTVTNLDPNFLVPEELLHKDQVFSWMYSARKLPAPNAPDKPGVSDVLNNLGIPRGMREVLAATIKATDFLKRGREDMVAKQFAAISQYTGFEVKTLEKALGLLIGGFVGVDLQAELAGIIAVADAALEANPSQVANMQRWMRNGPYKDFLDRQLSVLRDYLKGYEQFNQTWVYASKRAPVEDNFHPSTRDLDSVRFFYGAAFEQLSSGLALPACINNIVNGRNFDVFQTMSLSKYLTIDKAGRARCLEGNGAFAPLWDEFDSSLRNGSHHRGLRLKPDSEYVIEYRTGDGQAWKNLRYSEYLWRCCRIQICLVRLLALQLYVLGASSVTK